ncbi:DUF2267 domain-containing protein [Nocardia sp. NBC_00881]|uniref:DUF2267 domain-containing protein n=1 Tax=Nocardia sp. NBC_00881 TaxID=2975995 RepID=UPI00386EB021
MGHVQAEARLASRGEAEGATRATLETLAERIPEHLADKLASQLPQELSEHLRRVAASRENEAGDRFDSEEFLVRVARHAHTTEPKAAEEAKAVLTVLDEATTGDLTGKTRAALPQDIRQLLGIG